MTKREDAISRQAVLDMMQMRMGGKELYKAVYELPSVKPQTRWIPVSERLPYPWDEKYLVTLAWGGIGVMEYKSTGFHNYGSFSPVPLEAVTAWMPLPEPYVPDINIGKMAESEEV